MLKRFYNDKKEPFWLNYSFIYFIILQHFVVIKLSFIKLL